MKERLTSIGVQELDQLYAGRLLYDYLISLINYAETRNCDCDKSPTESFAAPASAEGDVPSRRRLLSSLYQRVFHSADEPSSQ